MPLIPLKWAAWYAKGYHWPGCSVWETSWFCTCGLWGETAARKEAPDG